MFKRPTVSVIIIVKDGFPLIRKAIRSVLSQSFQDFEVLIVDDGSTDRTPQIIALAQEQDRRIRGITNAECLGRATSRNRGLDNAKGKYVIFLDADDTLPNRSLEQQIDAARLSASDIVYGNTKCYDQISGEKSPDPHYTTKVLGTTATVVNLKDKPNLVENHQIVGRIYRLDFLKKHNIRFSNTRRSAEDVLFSFYTIFFARKASIVPNTVVYNYRRGNYLAAADREKLEDERDNVHETLLFSQKSTHQDILDAMEKKAAVFVSNLFRAEAVFGNTPGLFAEFIATLAPIVEHIEIGKIAGLTHYQTHFCLHLQQDKFEAALSLWKATMRTTRKQDITLRPNLSPDFNYEAVLLDSGQSKQFFEEKLKEEEAKLNKRTRRLAAMRSSRSMRFSGLKVKVDCTSAAINPAVSVIVPVYNVANYLDQCLQSVFNQTLRNIEVICIDDCSSDNSREILDFHSTNDKRVRVLSHRDNKGLSATRNTGMKAAQGDYIFFLDADDFIPRKESLMELHKTALTYRADQVIGGVIKWDETSNMATVGWHRHYLIEEVHERQLSDFPELRCNVVAWNKLIRRKLLAEQRLTFNEEIRKHEDDPFSLKLHLLSERISVVPRLTYVYRQSRPDSITGSYQYSDLANVVRYCTDVFETLFSTLGTEEVRARYAPNYAQKLINSIFLITSFNPPEHDIQEFLKSWDTALKLTGDNEHYLRSKQVHAFRLVRETNVTEAVNYILSEFDAPISKKQTMEVEFFPEMKLKLDSVIRQRKNIDSQIRQLKASTRWRLTAPLRTTASHFRNK